jgi:hypothetical protein
MKTLITTVATAVLAFSFVASANATTKSEARQHIAAREAACKEQAAKKVSAIHFMQRRELVNQCMGRTAKAKVFKSHRTKVVAHKKSAPTTTGQSVK